MHPHLIYILTIFCKLLHYNLLAVLDVETLVEVLEALAYVLSVYGVYAVVCLCAFYCYETDACSRVAYVSCVRHVRLAVSVNHDYVVLVVACAVAVVVSIVVVGLGCGLAVELLNENAVAIYVVAHYAQAACTVCNVVDANTVGLVVVRCQRTSAGVYDSEVLSTLRKVDVVLLPVVNSLVRVLVDLDERVGVGVVLRVVEVECLRT